MYASMVNQVDVVDVLLKKKASPTVQDIVGQTPLHLAASHVRDYLSLSLSPWIPLFFPECFWVFKVAVTYCNWSQY